ncbi:hypothetical protein EBT16_12270, partial [bacterium]|nr:hypothetical protein [bacterium]
MPIRLSSLILSVFLMAAVGSLQAREVFFAHLSGEWDNQDPLVKKQELLKEAEALALEAAKKTVAKWAQGKTSKGKLMNAEQIIYKLTGRNLADEEFHEWDRFLNEEGKLNWKSWPLGRDPKDSVAFISTLYPGSRAERREEARKKAELQRREEAALGTRSDRSGHSSDWSNHD